MCAGTGADTLPVDECVRLLVRVASLEGLPLFVACGWLLGAAHFYRVQSRVVSLEGPACVLALLEISGWGSVVVGGHIKRKLRSRPN